MGWLKLNPDLVHQSAFLVIRELNRLLFVRITMLE